jgi:hypothetical protein
MCDYRVKASLDHLNEWRCWTRLRLPNLVGSLAYIMRNQDRFQKSVGTSQHGLIVVFTPSQGERSEAAALIAQFGTADALIFVAQARGAAIG